MSSRFGSLRWRLLAAFLGVAVGGVALLAAVAAVSVDRRTTALVAEQEAQLRDQVASALAAAYTAGRGEWQADYLTSVQALAAAEGAQLQVLDRHGRPVAMGHDAGQGDDSTTPGQPSTGPAEPGHDPARPGSDHHGSGGSPMGAPPAPASGVLAAAPQVYAAPATGGNEITVPVVVDGTQVGTARLTLPAGAQSLVAGTRAALLRSVAIGAGLAVLLAAVAAVYVSRRMTRPLVALSRATRDFAAGRPVPADLVRPAPGEIGQLGAAFTAMAGTVRRQEELRRAVVADVAHELRTPVTILRGQTEQLLDGIAAPDEARLLSLHDEVLRLERLTEDLAALSAADAAGLSLHPEPTDLAQLARQAAAAMRAGFQEAGVRVRVEGDGDVVVPADPGRMTQVVTNLLGNAAKFTPAGGSVTVDVRGEDGDAVLTVTDSGPGIPEEDLPHVFERFWRGSAAGGRSGSGIGLAVVDALVGAHGGTVRAESPAGGGARFVVRLPMAMGDSGPTGRGRPALAVPGADGVR